MTQGFQVEYTRGEANGLGMMSEFTCLAIERRREAGRRGGRA